MTLVTAKLKQGLLAVMETYPENVDIAAQGLADAYAAYAADGTFLAGAIPCGPVTVTPAMTDAMKSTLKATMETMGESAQYALAWQNALAAFWVGAVIGAPNPGTSTSCPGASAAYTAILVSLQSLPDSIDKAAGDLANALATATVTVIGSVTVPGPPPVVTAAKLT